ncbi:MAG: 23S rRNA (uracil(1939)-C(5))-methyltransferase RlmD [Phycisphaerae bacterium]
MATIVSCPHFPACSGCNSIGIDYAEQLEAKLCAVRGLFRRSSLRSVEATPIQSIAASPNPGAYRNRVKLVPARSISSRSPKRWATPAGTGRIILGLYKAGSHEVIDIPGCPTQMDGLNRAVEVIRTAIEKSSVCLYDEVQHTGDLRFVTARQGVATGEILIGFVTRTEEFPCGDQLACYVMNHCNGTVGVVQNINPKKGNVIFGSMNRLLAGRDHLEEVICGTRIRLGVTSFFQVNTAVAEKAYESILAYVTCKALAGEPPVAPGHVTLLDLYAGVGTIGLVAARHVRQVYGIEEVGEAVGFARAAAHVNGVDNAVFQEGLVEQRLPQLTDRLRKEGVDRNRLVVVVNPPRKGLDARVIEQLLEAGPVRIAYLSCAPDTLLRDLVRFENGGYRVAHVELFDMFPQTGQVETLAIIASNG